MQGVYWRRNHHCHWKLLKLTKSVTNAELVMLAHAKKFPVGRFVYLECLSLPETTWDLRTLRFRTIANRLAKQILGGWKKIRKGGRMIWVRDNPKQLRML